VPTNDVSPLCYLRFLDKYSNSNISNPSQSHLLCWIQILKNLGLRKGRWVCRSFFQSTHISLPSNVERPDLKEFLNRFDFPEASPFQHSTGPTHTASAAPACTIRDCEKYLWDSFPLGWPARAARVGALKHRNLGLEAQLLKEPLATPDEAAALTARCALIVVASNRNGSMLSASAFSIFWNRGWEEIENSVHVIRRCI